MDLVSPPRQATWITELTPADQADRARQAPAGPLAGMRFAIKDNIDLAGVPTTAGDPRKTTPATASAYAVQRLLDAGAVPVGKTNLDQYATGLVGTRSPYGACHSVYSPLHVSGGSSSGSAVAVAEGIVDFALGTDTAGSGRVPAAFNGLVGIKPSKGLVSTTGVVPACRSLDCVTVFARDVATARRAYDVMVGFDAADPYARRPDPRPLPNGRPRIGVPDGPLGMEPEHEKAWQQALAHVEEIGAVVPVDVEPFLAAAALLYSGPWLAERWLAFGDALDDDPAVDPTVRQIVRGGRDLRAADAFADFHRLAALARACEPTWERIDALLLPVTPEHPTLAAVAADPVGVNSRLGRFTNMTNLLDLCAIAVPGPARADGLPFGVQLLAPAGYDDTLAALGASWCAEAYP
ncbi:MAG: Allophanate hydrolase [Marmoricola sp.]|nr:Allophanate hydrolase [Marmoricola sp.]